MVWRHLRDVLHPYDEDKRPTSANRKQMRLLHPVDTTAEEEQQAKTPNSSSTSRSPHSYALRSVSVHPMKQKRYAVKIKPKKYGAENNSLQI